MFAMLWYSLDREPRQFGLLRQGDWLGIVTIAVGLGCLETVLEEGNKDDWFGSAFIVRLAIVAIVSLGAFIVIQLVRKNPLLHLKLLGRRNFGLGTVANFFFGLSMYGWIYIVPLYLIRIQGYNAEQVGTVLIWLGLPQLLILPFMPKCDEARRSPQAGRARLHPVHRRQPAGHGLLQRLLRAAVHLFEPGPRTRHSRW